MRFRLCVSFLLIFVIIGSLGGIILLIPMVVLPSVLEHPMYYDPIPIKCSLERVTKRVGNKKLCKQFSSCNQGCDKVSSNCTQFFVRYAYRDADNKNSDGDLESALIVQESNAPLKVNYRSCGELPEVDCTAFENRLLILRGRPFNCYRNMFAKEAVYNYIYIDPPYPIGVAIGVPCTLLFIALTSCFLLTTKYCRKTGVDNVAGIDYETSRKCAFEND